MSQSEVRSILNLPSSSQSSHIRPPTGAGPPLQRQRPEGVSREVYNLIGDNVPSLQAAVFDAAPALKFKERPKSIVKRPKVEKWVTRKFKPAGRSSSDGLQLSHWAKASSSAEPEDDPFYKYAQPSPTPVLDFSQHEYDLHLTDPEWTSHETSYLFGLLRTFDCRFVIVADRYAYPGERGEFLVGSESGGEASGSGKGKEKESRQRLVAGGGGGKKRSIEDIKSRYYSVCRRLVRSRPTGDEVGKTQMLQYYAFDRERELARKVYASSLFDLTKEQLEEEEALYLECKRMEQQERTFRAERDELMKSLAGAATVVMAQIVSANSSSAEKKRKEAAALEGAVVGPNGLTGNKKLDKATKADLLHCIYRPPLPPVVSGPGTSSVKSAQTLPNAPVYLRSTRVPVNPPKPSEEVVLSIIASLSPPVPLPGKLVMPTRGNLDKMEGLMMAAGGLGEMKAAVDKCEHEAKVLRERLEMRKRGLEGSVGTPGKGTGTGRTSAVSTPAAVAVAPSESRSTSEVPSEAMEGVEATV